MVMDGQLYSAPSIQSPIETGYGQISGNFDERESWLLATLMECPLPAPVALLDKKTF
jgi:preprotein translocase subunit SecD